MSTYQGGTASLEKVRDYLRNVASASKSEIARETGLSFPTAGRMVDQLCQAGQLQALPQKDATAGRSATLYRLDRMSELFLLLRMEGHNLRWAVRNLDAEEVEAGEAKLSVNILAQLDALVEQVVQRHPQLQAVVVGIAATVVHGIVSVEDECVGELRGVNLLRHFQNLVSLPVAVENDVNAAALGCLFLQKEKTDSLACIYMGESGPGAGLVLRGQVWYGASDAAGEVFYLPGILEQKEQVQRGFDGVDVVDYYRCVIQSIAAIVNPELVVLYSNQFIEDRVDAIRNACAGRVPPEILPHLELSRAFDRDYEYGLFSLGKDLLRG